MRHTKNIIYFICLSTVFTVFWGCEAMATLFHGPKPEEEKPVYTVTFDANGAGGAVPAPQIITQGTAITLPGEGGLTRGDDVFTGWNISKSGGGSTYPPESSYTVTADQTFYAQWADPAQVYTVTYNPNGAGGAPPSQQKVLQNGSVVAADKGNLTNGNKNFTGWNTAADGTGTNYSAGAALTVTANLTLYAQWLDPSVQRYTVTYHANGAGGTPPAAQAVNEGTNIALPGAGGLTYNSKTFTGWNTAANGSGTSCTAGAAFTVNANTTFYAQWASEPVVPQGATLAEKFAYIAGQFDNGAVYDITVEADESLAPTTVMTGGQNVTINLRGSTGGIKTVSLSTSKGHLFTVSAKITLKLENIKILGSGTNDTALIRISSGGTLVLDTGSEITGNRNDSNDVGGIFVDGGTVTMLAGKISDNHVGWSRDGGGVFVGKNGRFTMHGGTISANTALVYDGRGGGVYIESGGYFAKTPLMAGEPSGIIYGNDVNTEFANIADYDACGHAVYYNTDNGKKRNTTLGGFDVISTENMNIGWE
jgi:uncharacterized repeat protein (TIGR02543 family)